MLVTPRSTLNRPEQCGAGASERRMSTLGHLPIGIPSSVLSAQVVWTSRKSTAERSYSQQSILDLNPVFQNWELAKGVSLFSSEISYYLERR